MATSADVVVHKGTKWRLNAPKVDGWEREVRPGPNKRFMVSVDSHLSPSSKLFHERLDELGQEARDTAELFFNDMRVPADNLIGGVEGQRF